MQQLLTTINKKFNGWYLLVCSVCFIIVLLRSLLVPIAHDEVATFYYYIQPATFMPFSSHVDANGHFLNSLLSWLSYSAFGSSELALRIPGLMAFIVLCIAVFQFNRSVKSIYSKLIFTSAFILSFNILNFYSLCRGYGLTIAFLIFGLFYFFDYLTTAKRKSLLFALLLLQIALSAGLTLVFLLLLCGGISIVFLIRNKQLFNTTIIFSLSAYFGLIFFWIKYAFYLQENGALYYGGGNSYWTVTFKSLIDTVLIENMIIYEIIGLIFLALLVCWWTLLIKEKWAFLLKSRFAISFLMLLLLILAFYLLKLLFHVNYPEDRTGIFFYLLFILSIGFLADEREFKLTAVYLGIPCFFILHFAFNLNFSKHAWGFYETMPKNFYTILLEEQRKKTEPIMVGGHRVLELFFSYYNYNSTEKLSHMLPPEQMHMNCDYYVAWKKDEPYYKKYYNEMEVAKHWNMVLLKRKIPVQRELIFEDKNGLVIKGSDEFYAFYEKSDTVFTSPNPIMAKIDFSIENAPEPFHGWLVLQIDSAGGGPQRYFRRTPLNWVNLKWNHVQHFTTCLQTDNLPNYPCRLVIFLWNIDKKEIKMKINSLKLYHLNAEGITEASKAL